MTWTFLKNTPIFPLFNTALLIWGLSDTSVWLDPSYLLLRRWCFCHCGSHLKVPYDHLITICPSLAMLILIARICQNVWFLRCNSFFCPPPLQLVSSLWGDIWKYPASHQNFLLKLAFIHDSCLILSDSVWTVRNAKLQFSVSCTFSRFGSQLLAFWCKPKISTYVFVIGIDSWISPSPQYFIIYYRT